MRTVRLFNREAGENLPCILIAEIGINHNGSVQHAMHLASLAKEAGADVVKLQKRDPELATPAHRRDVLRESCTAKPGELITELEHRKRIELSAEDYHAFARHCDEIGIAWFASPWDLPSLHFLESMGVQAYKVASASVTDHALLRAIAATGKPVIASTGMSTLAEVDAMMLNLGLDNVVLLHTCSAYPAENHEINLRVMQTLRDRYGVPVGYSGHERGVQVSVAAAALGACVIERHFTDDRTQRGSDHSASLEPGGFKLLVRDVRAVEAALGSQEKRLLPSEEAARQKLRKVAA